MLYTVTLKEDNGKDHYLFVNDSATGQSAKDITAVPGLFEEEIEQNANGLFAFSKLKGSIGNYAVDIYAIEIDGYGSGEIYDITAEVSSLLTVPSTVIQTMLDDVKTDIRSYVEIGVESLKYYESLKENSKVCIQGKYFKNIPENIVKNMSSVRRAYNLKNTENQSVFQKSFDDFYCMYLPELETIHYNPYDIINALDVLRVIAPYRKVEGKNTYSYKGIYHTPYYKVDRSLRGMVPNYLNWIDGFSSNDMLYILPNEKQMANNLKMLIFSDISRYVVEMVSGIFFSTPLGSLISRLINQRDEEVIDKLLEDIKGMSNEEANLYIAFSDIEELKNNKWYLSDVIATIKKHLVIKDSYIKDIVFNRPVSRRVVECDKLPFNITLTDEQEQMFTEYMINNGFLTSAMSQFLLDICKKAYRVNWGHTGATMAIPGFVVQTMISNVDSSLSEYISSMMKDEPVNLDDFPLLYVHNQDMEDEDDMFGLMSGSSSEEGFTRLDYYITAETASKMSMNTLSDDYFVTKATSAQTREAAVVEYWRNINGDMNIDNFISGAYLDTADINIFIECFIKLMRWGERKPRTLVLQKHPEIRFVFDLVSGMITDNTTIVNEDDLVKVNGCDYSFVGYLFSNSNPTIDEKSIVGFVLRKDYGNIKKDYLATWLDIAEMVETSKINIGEFKSLIRVPVTDSNSINIEDYEREVYNIYTSAENIEEGLKLGIKPAELSNICLLTTPAVMNTAGYLRSLKNTNILTLKDRQYDLLRRYVEALNKLYVNSGSKVNGIETTMDVSELALEFKKFYTQGNVKKEHNEIAADIALKKLDLDGSGSSINWDTEELNGKFYVISDTEMQSVLPPINFTDESMKKLSSRVRNRIVLLLLQKNNKFIFCRKDITSSEVMIVSGKNSQGEPTKTLGHKPYKIFATTIENLQKGVQAKINKMPAVLHESLQEYF